MLSPLISALVFLINTAFGLYILLLMLRFLMQWLRVSIHNDPIQQMLWRLTTPLLSLVYNFIPSWRGIDIAAITLMLALKMLEVGLIAGLSGYDVSIMTLFIVSLADLLSLFIYIFIFAIVIQAIFSWISQNTYNPLNTILYQLTDPILRIVRQKMPPMQGMDFSPIFAIIALQLLDIILVGILRQFV